MLEFLFDLTFSAMIDWAFYQPFQWLHDWAHASVEQGLNEFKKSGARSDGQASAASRRPRDQ